MEGADRDLASRSFPFILKGMTLMVFLDQSWSEYVSSVFPGVVSRGIPFPLDEILKILFLSVMAVINDGLDFILLFPINDVWGWTRKVVPILTSFLKRRQEAGVEDVMNGPGWGQFQLCCHVRNHASDAKRSVAFGRKFQ